MGTFLSVLLDILAILVIIVVGSLVVVIFAELILHLLDGSRRRKEDNNEEVARVVSDDDIVVYSNAENPKDDKVASKGKVETIDDDKIEEIDYDKAIEEQKMLQSKNGMVTTSEVKSAPKSEPAKPVETQPNNDDVFWDTDEDEEFNKILDEVVAEAKKAGEVKEEKPEVKDEEVKVEAPVESKQQEVLTEETKKELEELKALKEQQKKELEEIKQMREDFAREKEEQLELYKENLAKAKEEELEKLRLDTIKEQEKLEKLQDELEDEKQKLEQEREKLKEVVDDQTTEVQEPIIKEAIIKDEEEINKLKYKNLMRMNTRLSRIIRDTERLQNQKQRELEKVQEEKQKFIAKQEEEKRKEQERLAEQDRIEQEKFRKQQEAQAKKEEISRKLAEASKKAGKYKLDTQMVKLTKSRPVNQSVDHMVIEEKVVTTTETIPGTSTAITTVEKAPLKSTIKPVFAKEYYEDKIVELEEELREAEKELRANKAEYIPLTRIHKAYARDSEKLRKKEVQVAKQKVALYGVNSKNVDPAKKAKLDENLQTLAELKDSVQHCEEIIKKNKDRYPVIEKNNQLITKQIERINEDIKVCEKALDYYKKNN